MQVSSVCQKLALVVRRILADRPVLFIGEAPPFSRMATTSTLLRGWASMLVTLRIRDNACFSPGFSSFLTAATGLQSMYMDCSSVAAVAQAEHILSGCKQIRNLHVSGPCILSKLPPALETVTWYFPGERTPAEQNLDVLLPPAFLYKLVGLTGLRQL